MRNLLSIAAVVFTSLLLVGAGIGIGDTTVLVSPPEAVAEQFTRKLAAARYDVAMGHLAEHNPAQFNRVTSIGDALRARAGAIDEVEGRPGEMTRDRATATAVLTTASAGELSITFDLVRRTGVWRIVTWSYSW